MMAKKNGNGKPHPDFKKEQQIEFPVTFDLKAVMLGTTEDEVNKSRLEEVLSKGKILFRFLHQKLSKKGNYVSYTYSVTLQSKQEMDRLYSELKGVKGLKFAL